MSSIIRAIPQTSGPGETFYDVSNLPWKQVKDFKDELGQQGFYVQDIYLVDPLQVMVASEMRRKYEEEQEK